MNKLILSLLLSSIWFQGISQNRYFHRVNQSDGLSNLINAHLSYTPDGTLWFSSRDGINQYLGDKVKTYRPPKYLDPNITSGAYQDKDGRIWFSSNNALNWINPHSDSVNFWQLSADKLSYHYLIHLEKGQYSWLSAYNHLYRIDLLQTPFQVDTLHEYSTAQAYPILTKSGTVRGLVRTLDDFGRGLEIISYAEGHSKPQIDTFFVERENDTKDAPLFIKGIYPETPRSIWLASNKGLLHLNPDIGSTDTINHHTGGYSGVVPGPDSSQLFLFTAYNSLVSFDLDTEAFGSPKQLINIEGTLQSFPEIFTFIIDPDNNLWLSAFNNGIFHTNLNNNKFRQLIPSKDLLDFDRKTIKNIAEADADHIYFSVYREGIFLLFRKEDNRWDLKKITFPNLPDQAVGDIYKGRGGKFWITTPASIWRWKPADKRLELFLQTKAYPYGLAELAEDHLLLLDQGGVYLCDSKTEIPAQSCLPMGNNFAQLYYEPTVKIAFAMSNNNRLIAFSPEQNCQILGTYQDVGFVNSTSASNTTDTIWLASSNGLFAFSTRNYQIQKVEDQTGWLNRSLISIVEDNTAGLWVGAYNGLLYYSPSSDSSQYFSASDGLYNEIFRENLALKTTNENILFGGNRGITALRPSAFELNRRAPLIYLNSCSAGDLALSESEFQKQNKLKIPYKNHDLNFQFSVIEYAEPQNNQFEAFLIKNGRDTLFHSRYTEFEIPELSEGNYQMHGYAYNGDQIRTNKPHTVHFTILPPWYRTWWARLLGFLAIAAVFYIWYRYRIRQVKKRETFKRKEAEFKQKEAEYKQLVAETETAVLRLQMNPHFLFNSMNSINRYILERDIDSASNYLDQFARLMRLMLELSAQPLITITEEIEFLELYLGTESRRLAQPLTYAFDISPEIDPEDVLLPTMILQPFVENAIWHGLSPKKTAGKITIRFSEEAGRLHCTVSDNGVGRAYHQKKTKTGPPSRAIEITRRRLELLETQFKADTRIQLEDTHPGTRVNILLPIIE